MKEVENIKSKNKKMIEKMIEKGFNETYDSSKSKTIQTFGGAIKNRLITMYMANNEQNQLTKSIRERFNNT